MKQEIIDILDNYQEILEESGISDLRSDIMELFRKSEEFRKSRKIKGFNLLEGQHEQKVIGQ